ncbi:5-formyltetrahydrofolate cyclo-ligase isoform X2 [Orussus abietinus]|uniref:5-formyltetrahydrofolate cyclo-ligase isoform X2 n=1 Tax=Orussus abietinus TaxID=222816 RepID=UPI000C715F1B|nr:5-formyltetrahydrofolate cyclo-ligase isoform X2 [Orussus abietinus]
MTAIETGKAALRNEMKKVLAGIAKDERKRQSTRIVEKLISLPQYQQSRRISLYLSTEDEPDTLPLLRKIFDAGKEAFVPRYRGKVMEMVKLHSMEDFESLPLTKWNIKQPHFRDDRENALQGGLDLIVLPGMAFTINGKRLGHGMGYYDKFLHECISSQEKKPHLIALAFNEQVKEEIPTTEKDVDLDMVLTEKDVQ